MRRGRAGLAAICLATFILLLDITIVQVALPSIRRDLGGGLSGLQWTVDAYALALAALVLALGVIADRHGRRRVFLAGLIGFTLASAACGIAPSVPLLDAARALQGVAGASLFATVLALIGQEYRGAERGKAIAAWGATTGAAVACGPVVGGVLTQYVSWRAIFFVNVPIGAVAVVLARRHLSEGRDPSRGRLDIAGVATLSGGLLAVVAGLLRGSAADWHGTLAPLALAIGVVTLLAFGFLQTRPGAIVDLSLFRSREFLGVSAAMVALASGMFAALLYVTLYLQNVRGYGPLACGLILMPLSATGFLVPLIARRLAVPTLSGRTLGSGLALIALGLGLLISAQANRTPPAFLAGLVLCGTGIGLANPSVAALGLAIVPPERSGLAAGLSNTFRLGGLALGVAVLGVAFQIGSTHRAGPVAAFHAVLVLGVALSASGAVAALTLVRHRAGGPTPVLEPAAVTTTG